MYMYPPKGHNVIYCKADQLLELGQSDLYVLVGTVYTCIDICIGL